MKVKAIAAKIKTETIGGRFVEERSVSPREWKQKTRACNGRERTGTLDCVLLTR